MADALPTRHYDKLHAYIHAVLRDMIARGKVRRAYGQNLDDVLHAEGKAVLAEIEGDLVRLGTEMGLSIMNAALGAAENLFLDWVLGRKRH